MIKFHLGKHEVKQGGIPILLPDIGTFFDNNVDVALSMVNKLHTMKCSIIKAEILWSSDICLDTHISEKFYTESGYQQQNYKELINRKVVKIEDYKRIFNRCNELGMDYVVSVYDFKGADYAVEWGACAIKVASSNITHIPLIRHVSKLGLPVIIDTGRSNWNEISIAVQTVLATGNEKLIVEHSPAPPPAPVEDHNLRMMNSLSTAFNVHPGLSDHHRTEEMIFAAVAMGVQILEKGVCLDDNKDDQDVYHALPISLYGNVLEKCLNIYHAQGKGTRFIAEEKKKTTDRMCLVAMNDLYKGDVISLKNVTFAFPQIGIPVSMWDTIVGKKVLSDILKGTVIYYSNVDYTS